MAETWTKPAPAFPVFPPRDGLAISEISGRAIVTIVARTGQEAALRAAVAERFGVSLPDGPSRAAGPGTAFLGIAPGKWLAVGAPVAELAALSGLAAVVDQSGAYGVLGLGGKDAATILARAVSIDLDPGSFAAGTVATTVIEHIGVTLAMISAEPPAFELYVVRSYAHDLAHWLGEAIV